MKKFLILLLFFGAVFSQDGRYERITDLKRFDTKTGEVEYFQDNKWRSLSEVNKIQEERSEHRQKLQLKELMSFPDSEKDKVGFVEVIKYEAFRPNYNMNNSHQPKAIAIDKTITFTIENNSSWKIEEIDVEIYVFNDHKKIDLESMHTHTISIHNNVYGLPGSKEENSITLPALENGKWQYRVAKVRGFDPENPPKLSWWE